MSAPAATLAERLAAAKARALRAGVGDSPPRRPTPPPPPPPAAPRKFVPSPHVLPKYRDGPGHRHTSAASIAADAIACVMPRVAGAKRPSDDSGDAERRKERRGRRRAEAASNIGSFDIVGRRGGVGCRDVDDFETVARLSEGVYGVVYKARETATGALRALKFIKTSWFQESQVGFPVYLLREFDLLMRCRHPNVVQGLELTHTTTSTGGSLIFLVTELAERGDLKDTIYSPVMHVSSRLVPGSAAHAAATAGLVARAKSVLWQLLQGVAFLHARGVVHRDLKSSNALVDANGVVKVCDFGLARQFCDGQALSPNVVTLLYRAPELHLGMADYSAAVDVWSVGCVWAEALLKAPLFRGDDEASHFASVCDVLGAPTDASFPGFLHFPCAVGLMENVAAGVAEADARAAGAPSCLDGEQGGRLRRDPSLFGGPKGAALLSECGLDLLRQLLAWNPKSRVTAAAALSHPFFAEAPLAAHPSELTRPLCPHAPLATAAPAAMGAEGQSPESSRRLAAVAGAVDSASTNAQANTTASPSRSPELARPVVSPSRGHDCRQLANMTDDGVTDRFAEGALLMGATGDGDGVADGADLEA